MRTLAIIFLLASPLFAQVSPQIQGAGAPTNPCYNGGQQYVDQTNHVIYNCSVPGQNWVNVGQGNATGIPSGTAGQPAVYSGPNSLGPSSSLSLPPAFLDTQVATWNPGVETTISLLQTKASYIDGSGNWYVANSNSIYQSTNSGVTWTALAGQPAWNAGTSFRSIHVAANGSIYVATDTATSTAADMGLWRDVAGTWTRVLNWGAGQSNPTVAAYTQGSVWAIAEDSNGLLYAGIYCLDAAVQCAIIYQSSDNGTTWTTSYTDATGRHIHDIEIDASNNVYATMGDAISPWNTNKIIKSANLGVSWNQILASLPQMVGLAISSTARLFFTDGAGVGGSSPGIYRTTDDSTATRTFTLPSDAYNFWARRDSSSGAMYGSFITATSANQAATIYKSSDDGVTWTPFRQMFVNVTNGGSAYASNIVNSTLIISRNNSAGLPGEAINLGNVAYYSNPASFTFCDLNKTPCVVGQFQLSNLSATTSQSLFACPTSGMYRVDVATYVVTPGTGGSIESDVRFNTGSGSKTFAAGAACNLASTDSCGQSTPIFCGAGNTVTVDLNVVGTVGSLAFSTSAVAYREQ